MSFCAFPVKQQGFSQETAEIPVKLPEARTLGRFITLSEIHFPEDIKKFSSAQLVVLASEIRAEIIGVVQKNGGHLASNLGTVELTIALHRAFDSPVDALVWDVSHQSYTHKLLTGRYDRFNTLRKKDGISGFTKRSESPHDFFDTGHASTSISSALGLLTGRRLTHSAGKVVAVIGDGSLTGGMALEALSHAGQLANNLIVILNDNQMSISRSTGSISRYLSKITMTTQYQGVRHWIDRLVTKIPVFNRHLAHFVFRFKRALKGLLLTSTLFSDFGFEYAGFFDGHNIEELEAVFRKVKKLNLPVVVHVLTKKGKGYPPAEYDPEGFHGVLPAHAETNVEKITEENAQYLNETFTSVFSREILRAGEADSRIAAITAAMVKGCGLTAFAKVFPDRFFDTGIAEEHAVTFAAGLAAAGIRPVAAIYSTFLQRAVDQIIHDVALPATPVVFALDRAGAVPEDGETHQGIFDIALLLPIPNLVMLAPASARELELALQWALNKNAPVVIRYPKNRCPEEHPSFFASLEEGRGVLLNQDEFAPESAPHLAAGMKKSKTLLVCTGGIFPETLEAARLLIRENFAMDIYNLRFLKPLDETYFLELAAQYGYIFFIEDGVKTGGIGRFLERLVQKYVSEVSTLSLGFPDRFLAQGSRREILEDAELSPEKIAGSIRRILCTP